MKEIILRALIEVDSRFSPDRIVADPVLNSAFIQQCRILGSRASEVELNMTLLNLRKAGLLTGRPRSARTSFDDEENYRHASEVAVRFLEKRERTTLDRIICDLSLAAELDRIASDIAPGFSSLQYRWAALNLRKARSLRPELLSQVVRPDSVALGRIDCVDIRDLPNQQGLYVFYGPKETLYVGEASNLRRRLAKHLDHSDNKNLARWFWSNGFKDVRLEMQLLNEEITTKVRKALEAELISSRHPIFNVQGIECAPA